MKNFLTIYYSTPEKLAAFAELSEVDKQQGMEAWGMWKEKHGEAVIDLGAPLMPPISMGNQEIQILPNQIISGYSIVKAESIEEAKLLFSEHPYKENGIHIFECISM